MSEKEYIERGALIEGIKKQVGYEEAVLKMEKITSLTGDEDITEQVHQSCKDRIVGFERAANVSRKIPAADVVEVRHGYWILWKPRCENRNATYKCSVCGKLRSSYYNDVGEWEYCPCGARMDVERKDKP